MVEFKANFHELISRKDWNTLKSSLHDFDSIQIAQLIEDLPDGDEIILFRLLNRKESKDVFELLSHLKQEQIIERLARKVQEISNLLNDIEPDVRTAFFEELPGKISRRLITLLSPAEREITTRLLGYPALVVKTS